jgi:hypothetical protein
LLSADNYPLDFGRAGNHNTRMTNSQRKALQERWNAIELELADLLDGKVTVGTDPASRESELREEQDEIEFELGSDNLDCGLNG